MTTHEPRALLTVPATARLLHVSDDTVRRQIRGGDLVAIQIGTTPTGRPRYRVPVDVVEERLGRSALQVPSATEELQAAFAVLTDVQRETLLQQAIEWARAQAPEAAAGEKSPEPTREEIARRFRGLAGRRTG